MRRAPFLHNCWSGKAITCGAATVTLNARAVFSAKKAHRGFSGQCAEFARHRPRRQGLSVDCQRLGFSLQRNRAPRGASPARPLSGSEFAPHPQSVSSRAIQVRQSLRKKESRRGHQRRCRSGPHQPFGKTRRRPVRRGAHRPNSLVRKFRKRRSHFAMVTGSVLRRSGLQPTDLSQRKIQARQAIL